MYPESGSLHADKDFLEKYGYDKKPFCCDCGTNKNLKRCMSSALFVMYECNRCSKEADLRIADQMTEGRRGK